jgi:hypothetical protein
MPAEADGIRAATARASATSETIDVADPDVRAAGAKTEVRRRVAQKTEDETGSKTPSLAQSSSRSTWRMEPAHSPAQDARGPHAGGLQMMQLSPANGGDTFGGGCSFGEAKPVDVTPFTGVNIGADGSSAPWPALLAVQSPEPLFGQSV